MIAEPLFALLLWVTVAGREQAIVTDLDQTQADCEAVAKNNPRPLIYEPNGARIEFV